jgi:hypothetical protein
MTDSLPTAQCRLTLAGLSAQRARYRRLARDVIGMERSPTRLTVQFDAGVDLALVRETVAIERECCPFFAFEFDPALRSLRIGVARPEQDPALDALRFALGES